MGIKTEICQHNDNDKIWVLLFSEKIKTPVLAGLLFSVVLCSVFSDAEDLTDLSLLSS